LTLHFLRVKPVRITLEKTPDKNETHHRVRIWPASSKEIRRKGVNLWNGKIKPRGRKEQTEDCEWGSKSSAASGKRSEGGALLFVILKQRKLKRRANTWEHLHQLRRKRREKKGKSRDWSGLWETTSLRSPRKTRCRPYAGRVGDKKKRGSKPRTTSVEGIDGTKKKVQSTFQR